MKVKNGHKTANKKLVSGQKSTFFSLMPSDVRGRSCSRPYLFDNLQLSDKTLHGQKFLYARSFAWNFFCSVFFHSQSRSGRISSWFWPPVYFLESLDSEKLDFHLSISPKNSNKRKINSTNGPSTLSQKWITFTRKGDWNTTETDPTATEIHHQAVAEESIHNYREVESTVQ